MRHILPIIPSGLLRYVPVASARKWLQYKAPQNQTEARTTTPRQLLVDVSVIVQNDARTGIQRAVRAILLQLLTQPPAGWTVRPVFATRNHGYHYAPEGFGLPDTQPGGSITTAVVKVDRGDQFLGLDLAAHLLPIHIAELAKWKRLGARIHIVVYDLLPVLHQEWFAAKTTRNFHRWLRTIAMVADSIVCISHAVKTELNAWLCKQYSLVAGTIPISIIPLGADIESSVPSRGLPDSINLLRTALAQRPTILMVGTLEPRKGHQQVLSALEKLWQENYDINLMIVGKPGWKTEALQQCLRTHPQHQRRLYWLDNASDELLELLYIGCTGVIVASQAEGFGLPLIEATHHHKPVLARDIPIFREIGGDYVTFFSGSNSESLSKSIKIWLAEMENTCFSHPNSPRQTWYESAQQLIRSIQMATADNHNYPSAAGNVSS